MSAEASHGRQLFLDTLEQSTEGQTWSVDAEFATGTILDTAEEKQVILNTPPRQVTSRGKFPKTEFVYDATSDTSTCPHGKVLSHTGTTHKTGERHYRPEKGTSDACPFREQGTSSKTGRTVTRNPYEASWERQRDHARPPEGRERRRARPLWGIILENIEHFKKK